MARRKSSEYRTQATKEPFEVELEDGTVVTLADPNRLGAASAFELANERDPKRVLELLLGEDFPAFWAEFASRPTQEVNELIDDSMSHYGANPKSDA